MRRVGVLAPSTAAKEEVTLKPFFHRMEELGWIEGRTVAYDRVYADDLMERLPMLAAELVARKPDLIYAPPAVVAVAVKQATQTIPIVFAFVLDPVGSGLVTSLARPGGNVTGILGISDSLAPKRVELLRTIAPGARHIGLLSTAHEPASDIDRKALASVAKSLGLKITVAEVSTPSDFDAAVGTLIAAHVDVIFQSGNAPVIFNLRNRLIEQARQHRIAVVGGSSRYADDGALFSYGASFVDRLTRSANMADRILRGAKPAELPVEQATLFEFVINTKAARALGITIPRPILVRADRVIE
jgi:putative tryptophan/tyrosine transport system substrate-binding protein